MKYRIAIWTTAGFLIAGCWAIYFALASKSIPIESPVFILAFFSQPVALLSFYFHFPMSFYSVMAANAATYALAGLIAETVRRQLHHAR